MRPLVLAVSTLLVIFTGSLRSQPEQRIRPRLTDRALLSEWTLDGSGSWEIEEQKLRLIKAGTPGGPIRRPAALAILKTDSFKQATLELELRSTAPVNVARRDVDLVIGYESPTRFYYVHLSAVTDDVHNGIFIVADSDRRRIDSGQGVPRMTDREWHRVKVTRDGGTGRIEVFFDASKAPILAAVDLTISSGRVGVGSFDDTAEFRRIQVRGAK